MSRSVMILTVVGAGLALWLVAPAAGARDQHGSSPPASRPAVSTPPTSDEDDEGEPSALNTPLALTVANASGHTVVTGDAGRTVYVFSADHQRSSACAGACAATWSPVRSYGGKPRGSGALANAIGSVLRPDGTYQVTLNGSPLYYYAGDQVVGQAYGEGRSEFGGMWHAASPAGNS
jgi:predicted lipoprotein with Yx(FWY)xxD motif